MAADVVLYPTRAEIITRIAYLEEVIAWHQGRRPQLNYKWPYPTFEDATIELGDRQKELRQIEQKSKHLDR